MQGRQRALKRDRRRAGVTCALRLLQLNVQKGGGGPRACAEGLNRQRLKMRKGACKA